MTRCVRSWAAAAGLGCGEALLRRRLRLDDARSRQRRVLDPALVRRLPRGAHTWDSRKNRELGAAGFENVVAAITPVVGDDADTPAHWSVTFSTADADATATFSATTFVPEKQGHRPRRSLNDQTSPPMRASANSRPGARSTDDSRNRARPTGARLLRLEFAPAAGAVVGDDLFQHRCQRSTVDAIGLPVRDRSCCLVCVAGGDDPFRSGTMPPS
jgi:hypothetical protein